MPTCFACLLAHVSMCLTHSCAHVPTCLACLRAHMPTCHKCLSAHMPTSLEYLQAWCVNMPCMFMYTPVNVACELTYLRVKMLWVPYLTQLVWPCDHLPTCFACLVSSFDENVFSLNATVIKLYTLLVRS